MKKIKSKLIFLRKQKMIKKILYTCKMLLIKINDYFYRREYLKLTFMFSNTDCEDKIKDISKKVYFLHWKAKKKKNAKNWIKEKWKYYQKWWFIFFSESERGNIEFFFPENNYTANFEKWYLRRIEVER